MSFEINKIQRANLAEIYAQPNGVIIASEWVTGSGRFITKRAIPPHCKRIERRDAHKYPKRISSIFNALPKVQAVVAIVNMRAAKKELFF